MTGYNERMDEVVDAWQPYVANITDWQNLVAGAEPKETGCGLVYELPNPIDGRPNESFAIVDMRDIKVAEPHFHTGGETEIYIVLEGLALVVVGAEEHEAKRGDVIITPPDTSHFTVVEGGLVIACINTPPFKPENYVALTESDPAVGFSQEQFNELSKQALKGKS